MQVENLHHQRNLYRLGHYCLTTQPIRQTESFSHFSTSAPSTSQTMLPHDGTDRYSMRILLRPRVQENLQTHESMMVQHSQYAVLMGLCARVHYQNRLPICHLPNQ